MTQLEQINTITTTFYKGDNTKFKWEKFVALHMEAHRKFEEINEPLPESMKILHLKTGIRPEAGLEAGLAVARSRPDINTTFDSFVTQITKGIANRRSRQGTFKMAPGREVSSFNIATGDRSRGRNSVRHSYHGGRGRGRFPARNIYLGLWCRRTPQCRRRLLQEG